MHAVARALALLTALASAGCDCGGETTAPAPVLETERVAEAERAPPVIEVTIPRTERTELPEAQPQVTLSVGVLGYRVDNRALVESWPAVERARAAESASPIDVDFPIVDVTIAATDPSPLLLPDLRDALGRAAMADRARDPSAGAPIAFALAASSEVSWGRVVRALYASAMVGYAEPSFVVRDAAGIERVVIVPNAHAPSVAHADDRVRAALAAIGAPVTDGEPAPPSEPDTGGEPVGPPIAIVLEEHGARVQRGLIWVGADCETPSADASPAIPSARLGEIAACIEALSPFDRASFAAAPEVTYGQAISILEALASTGRPLAIATVAAADGPSTDANPEAE